MTLKAFIRSLTPPAIYVAAHRIRKLVRSRQALTLTRVELATGSERKNHLVSAEASQPNLAYGHTRALEDRVVELKSFGFNVTPENAAAVLAFYNAYVPLIRSEARGAHLRTLLSRLKKSAPDIADQVAIAIARSDLCDGLPDRSQRLRSDPLFEEELARQITAMERAYGAKLITENWGKPSRGASLLYYLRAHPELVVGKDVLHVAPEDETREWISSVSNYKALDGAPDARTDIAADVTSIPVASGSFDVILCHRVLEHVFGDLQAMREFFRLLRPGGVLNLSVPQAAHRPQTAEWLVPDESHDLHVRQYGQDLTARLEGVGFQVRTITWLLERSKDELLSRSAYPMRMFEARR